MIMRIHRNGSIHCNLCIRSCSVLIEPYCHALRAIFVHRGNGYFFWVTLFRQKMPPEMPLKFFFDAFAHRVADFVHLSIFFPLLALPRFWSFSFQNFAVAVFPESAIFAVNHFTPTFLPLLWLFHGMFCSFFLRALLFRHNQTKDLLFSRLQDVFFPEASPYS